MKLRKALLTSLFVLFSIVAFAAPGFCLTAQRIVIPYGYCGGDWVTGVAVHNESEDAQQYVLRVYDESGTYLGRKCFDLEAKETSDDLLPNYIGKSISGIVSVYIRTRGAESDRFSATMYVVNAGTGNPGFGFQTYRSEDFSATFQYACKTLPPTY